MKKLLAILCVAAVITAVSCASKPSVKSGSQAAEAANNAAPRKVNGSSVPDFVQKALMGAGQDELIAIGAAKMSSISMSLTTANTRARAELSRQLNTMIKNMVTDYTAESEGSPETAVNFQENITQALSKSRLTGATVIAQDQGSDGTYWVVVSMSKSDVANEINEAAAQAKLNNSAMKAFDAQTRMEAAFAKMAAEDVQVVDK
ncbi:hypothetical protein AGMMS50212_04480 [Spirochaetia bacterium]|nr:hypothetical protein AGMMS50212_04480 [Spirochaetia bacterium]